MIQLRTRLASLRPEVRLAAGICIAFLAELVLTTSGGYWPGLALYAAAALLVVPAMRNVGGPAATTATLEAVESRIGTEDAGIRRESRRRIVVAAGALAVLCLVGTIFIEARNPNGTNPVSIGVWVMGLAAAAVAAALAGRVAEPSPEIGCRSAATRPLPRGLESALLLAIVTVAVLLRFVDLEGIPPFMHGDHALQGLAAREIVEGKSTGFFGLGYFGLPNLGYAASALGLVAFGDSAAGLRRVTALIGIVALLLTYVWARQAFGARVALIATFLMGVAHFSVHYSRDGCFYIQATAAVLLAFVFYWQGLQSGRAIHFLFAGFGLALCLAVYWAAWIAWAVVGLFELHRLATERRFVRRQLGGWAVMAAGAVLVFSPWALRYLQDPRALLNRPAAVFVLNPEIQTHLREVHRTNSGALIVLDELRDTLEAFNYRGDGSGQYGWPGPLLDFWTSALFALGIVYALSNLRQPRHRFCAIWFGSVVVIGGALTGGMPFTPRLVVLMPVLFVFPALVLDRAVEAGHAMIDRPDRSPRRGLLPGALVAAFLMLPLAANYLDYFVTYVKTVRPADDLTLLGYYLRGLPRRYDLYLVCPEHFYIEHPTVRFLSHDETGIEVSNVSDVPRVPQRGGDRGLAVVILRPDVAAQGDALSRLFPNARCDDHQDSSGEVVFRSCLIAAQGPGGAPDLRPSP